MEKFKRALKWLYPGMKIKRWGVLAALSALLIVLGILVLVGQDIVRFLYAHLAPNQFISYLLSFILLLLGVIGLGVGIKQVVHSLVRGISPDHEGRASEVLYAKRRLSRGPRIVAIGGGTGLSQSLRGLKKYTSNITAVVTVMDSGGSSGILREELEMLPPGDIRNCLIALAEDESRISKIFSYRFKNGRVKNHSLGNLFIAGMQELTGSFDTAIEETSHILNIQGQVLPATLENVDLVGELESGAKVVGEAKLAEKPGRIKKIYLSQDKVRPYQKVVEEINKADIIVLGPGSLFTSLISNLLVDSVPQLIEKAKALKFYVCNLMTQPGETDDFTVSEHLDTLSQQIDITTFDYIIINQKKVPTWLLKQYEIDKARPVEDDITVDNKYGLKIIREDLLQVVELEGKKTIKHDSDKLAKLIVENA